MDHLALALHPHRCSGSSRHSSSWCTGTLDHPGTAAAGAQALWIIQAQQQLVQHKDFNQLRFTGIQWNIARIVLKVQLCQGLEGNRSHHFIPFKCLSIWRCGSQLQNCEYPTCHQTSDLTILGSSFTVLVVHDAHSCVSTIPLLRSEVNYGLSMAEAWARELLLTSVPTARSSSD